MNEFANDLLFLCLAEWSGKSIEFIRFRSISYRFVLQSHMWRSKRSRQKFGNQWCFGMLFSMLTKANLLLEVWWNSYMIFSSSLVRWFSSINRENCQFLFSFDSLFLKTNSQISDYFNCTNMARDILCNIARCNDFLSNNISSSVFSSTVHSWYSLSISYYWSCLSKGQLEASDHCSPSFFGSFFRV